MLRGRNTLISAIILICTATAANAITPSFQGVGDLAGGLTTSSAVAVSADGQIVVGSSHDESQHAYRWESGQMFGLLDDWQSRTARDVSGDGSVVVGDGRFEFGDDNTGWVYSNGVVTSFGSLLGPGGRVDVHGVSGDGSVVVGYTDSDLGGEAFRWEKGVMTGLGDLEGGYFASAAWDVSADGSIVIGTGQTDSGSEAFRWENDVMVGLGFLDGGTWSLSRAISADGSIVVGRSQSENGMEVFRWEDGVMEGLGDLDGWSVNSMAYDVSADGSVVVGHGESVEGREAFYWNEVIGMVSLKDMLENDFELDLTGWTLTSAYGVSADGLTIVGSGVNPDGNREGWIATIPEPATLWLIAMGAALLKRRRTQRFKICN